MPRSGAGTGGCAAHLISQKSKIFDSFPSRGERAERCQWQEKRGERVAAVEKIEEKRKPEDFFGHRNRRAKGRCRARGRLWVRRKTEVRKWKERFSGRGAVPYRRMGG